MRNRFCLLLALLMLFIVCVPAFAADDDTADKIEVTVVYGNDGLLLNKCKPDQSFTLVHAVYTEDGALQNVQIQEIDLDGYYFTMVNITEPYSTRSKIFLWESLKSMKPIEFVLNISGAPQNTADPTENPIQTEAPSVTPKPVSTDVPTSVPTATPTSAPTATPMSVSTATPTSAPTATPTPVPTATPTSAPTATPTSVPTATPTSAPTATPTSVSTATPTSAPTATPTSTPAVRVRVAEPIEQLDIREMAKLKDSTLVQSFTQFANGYAYLSGKETTTDGKMRYVYQSSDSYSRYVVRQYISLFESDNMNFSKKSGQERDIGDYSIFDYHFTCNAIKSTDDKYDVTVYGVYDSGVLKDFKISIPEGFEYTDLGYREDDMITEPELPGESAMAGLYRNPNGSYETDDGRLKTAVGHAMVLVDGVEAEADATYMIYTNKKEVMEATGYSGNNQLYFRMPYQYTLSGDLYDLEDLKGNHKTYQNNNWSPNSYSPGASLFAQTVQLNLKNQWIFPQFDATYNHYDALTVRVMYYERGGDAVFYIYSGQDVTPKTIEALCAVNMDVEEIADSGSSGGGSSSGTSTKYTCVTCGGDGKCHKCNGTGRIVRYVAGGGTLTSDCPYCHGSGKCYSCGGTGER